MATRRSNVRECNVCHRFFKLCGDNFYKRLDSFQHSCKECQKEQSRIRRADPDKKERIDRKRREYYRANREECQERTDRWQAENMDKVRAAQRNWIVNKYHSDANYKKAHLIRTRLNNAYRCYVFSGEHQEARYGDMDYEAILTHMGPCPGEYGRGRGLYSFDHIINLRNLDLSDPVEWAIAVHPRNVRWMLWELNYRRDRNWTDEAMELYRELRAEVLNARNKNV